jgi:hypothetical protein
MANGDFISSTIALNFPSPLPVYRVRSGTSTHSPKEYGMNPYDVIYTWNQAAFANPPASLLEANQKYLSDDFQNLDVDGEVVADKKAYSALAPLMFTAFPDLHYVWEEHQEQGNDAVVKFHWEGTFAHDLDLSPMGMGVIKATGKKIVWPQFQARFSTRNEQITGIREIHGGIGPFLEPLGVKQPPA